MARAAGQQWETLTVRTSPPTRRRVDGGPETPCREGKVGIRFQASARQEPRWCGVRLMVTRQSELLRVLGQLAEELPAPDWVALVDSNGLIVACVPNDPAVDADRISAMTAASVQMGDRVLKEIDGGGLRYASIAGSVRQHLTVVLSKDRLLSIGLKPDVPAHATFGPVGRWVPELLRALHMRIRAE